MSEHGAYRRAVEARDRAGLSACFAEDMVFHSPTKQRPFEGRAFALWLFDQLFEVLEDFQFTEEAEGAAVSVLFFTCTIGGRAAEGCDVLRFDEAGLIRDFRVLIRPLKAVEALNQAMGARLAGQTR